ncbi:proline dehydrogenase [Rhodopseudomonas palustris]|uniref:L-proline dehydrogenase n=1 Tax=Rhodopseudomonas palustris (strain BisB18) TaxID=316056 RepID=Q21BK1_RHOPB
MNVKQQVFDTAPPPSTEQSPWQGWKRGLRDRLSASILPLVEHAARPYLGGDTVEDALCVARRLALENAASTLGFWDTADYAGREVADIYLASIARLSDGSLDSYVSVKPPALRFDPSLAIELAAAAAASGVRLHCDSHGIEVADRSNAMLQAMLTRVGAGCVGTTLPGRWARSVADADWAVANGLNVRVVKGQWPDPGDPQRDMGKGFLDVIDRLAGRARHIAVATHDLPLASEAIRRIRATGTSYELELLFGMPLQPLRRWAADHQVKTRIYVPFGKGFIPNALNVLRQNPGLMWRIAKRRLTGR